MRLQLLLLALGVCAFAQRPNSQIRIYESAFKFLTKATCHIADTEVSKLGANFITFNTTIGSGEVILKTSLSVDKFVCPILDSYISDKDGIHFSSSQGVWRMKGLWSAVYHNPFGLPIDSSANGDAVLSATDLDVDLAAKIVVGADKHPQLQMGECKAKLGVFDYKFNGKFADLPNMFNDFLGTIVKNIVKDLACQITQNTILTKYNEVIAKIPLHYELPYNFSLDWALYEPRYTNNLVEMKGAAKVAYGKKPCESHVTYDEVFQGFKNEESAKDVVIWLGQSLSACALKSVHESQLIKLPINIDSLPDYKDRLSTRCGGWLIFKGGCIGAALKGLSKVGDYAELLLFTAEAPQINLKQGYVEIYGKFGAEVYEYPMEKHPKVLGKILITATAKVKPKIVNKHLIGECDTDDIDPKLDIVKGYKITGFTFGYEKITKGIFKKVSKVLFFAILQAGLPLPSFDGAAISDKTQIDVFDKVIRINMGLELNGK
ncbi:unnamed protein product [Cylicocyclus nassatus]|uniref:Uncharacterized protein n=1 Tax=Cylicocyclus nassatus TaxID=53992 RepID=A0AA36GS99_CYLNA|nr:unnamed protein product [Cylicocyclus nassatus]